VLAQPARLALQPYRRLFWGEPSPCRAEPLSEGAHLGSERYTFHILYTPGHSPDHLCLFEPDNGWLFSGDLYVGGKDQALREGSDFWGILKALKYVAKLPITLLFPGSARVRPYPAQALQEKVDYLEELAGQVLELHRRGWSKRRIARRLLRAPRALEWLTLGHFSRRHLIRSILRGAGG
jgi:glyoxylase-like metal-dependent hydrolase (beta-lactamase superfamily II)